MGSTERIARFAKVLNQFRRIADFLPMTDPVAPLHLIELLAQTQDIQSIQYYLQ